jgi:cell division protein ZapA
MKKPIEVEIFGQSFTVSSEDEEVYVKTVAAYLDQRMRQIGGNTKTAVPMRVAIMAALGIADDYHKALRREAEMQDEVDRLSALLLARLEQSEQREKSSTASSTVNAFTADSPKATLDGEAKKEAQPPS